jgi:SAM-dependent methyltransferase
MVSSHIPEIFVGARDYRKDCDAMDHGQATFNEERLYCALERFALGWFEVHKRSPFVLDLCCATGLSATRIASVIPVAGITLVDVDKDMLHRAAVRCSRLALTDSWSADAVTFSSSRSFDIILMNSSYHHIEDSRKVQFLTNARTLLAADGVVLVGENFIFDYARERGNKQSVVRFYGRLLKALSAVGESPQSINVIRRSGLYCWEGFYEYKVSRAQFLAHCKEAGLALAEYATVWAATDDPRDFAGSCALSLSKG